LRHTVLSLKIKRLVSPASNLIVSLATAFPMSLIYIRKDKGPSTEPCGTPQETQVTDD